MGNVRRFLRESILAEAVILSVIVFFLLAPQFVLRAQDDAMHGMHDGMSMPMDSPMDTATQAALLAWKRESEFNHHLLIFSDTELWPFGEQSWYFGLTHHKEVLQHKVFAVLLLAVGVIELQRARGILKARWAGWVFPVVASVGSLMLLFHEHQGGMTGPNHMELMHRIQSQHISFSVTGLGIALSKGLAETPFEWRPFFERLFPTLLVVLGALLLVYVE